jgi:hypothetical protein
MHEAALALAALPAPTVVFGMLLRPYSLGHELFLIREQNPIALGTCKVEREHLALAVLICCQSYEEAKRTAFDPLIRLKLWLWKRRTRHCDFKTELAAFREYQKQGSLEFPVSDVVRPDRKPSSRAPGTPFILRLHQWLIEHLRLTEVQAWDYPLGLAKMRWACHWEMEGGLDIYNAHDAEFDRFVSEQEAKGQEALAHG